MAQSPFPPLLLRYRASYGVNGDLRWSKGHVEVRIDGIWRDLADLAGFGSFSGLGIPGLPVYIRDPEGLSPCDAHGDRTLNPKMTDSKYASLLLKNQLKGEQGTGKPREKLRVPNCCRENDGIDCVVL
eukprot:1322747-Amorphochlora_amoeboformis.AAC.1